MCLQQNHARLREYKLTSFLGKFNTHPIHTKALSK